MKKFSTILKVYFLHKKILLRAKDEHVAIFCQFYMKMIKSKKHEKTQDKAKKRKLTRIFYFVFIFMRTICQSFKKICLFEIDHTKSVVEAFVDLNMFYLEFIRDFH